MENSAVDEYYKTENDLMALLLKTPILESKNEHGEFEKEFFRVLENLLFQNLYQFYFHN